MFPQKKHESTDTFYKLFLTAFSLFVTVIYLFCGDPFFFHIAFATLTVVSALLPWYNFNRISNTSATNARIIKKLRFIFLLSTCAYIFGFTLWNIEQHVCNELRDWRNTVGHPVRIFGEFHAWWHLFAGYATYAQLVTSHYARFLVLKNNKVELKYVWFIPYIVPKKSIHKVFILILIFDSLENTIKRGKVFKREGTKFGITIFIFISYEKIFIK